MPNTKGGQEVTRQTFSMHPDLMQTIMSTANSMNQERVAQIAQDRSRRVTFSKVVAALAWLLRTRYLDEDRQPTDEWKELLQSYENSDFEKREEPKRKRKK